MYLGVVQVPSCVLEDQDGRRRATTSQDPITSKNQSAARRDEHAEPDPRAELLYTSIALPPTSYPWTMFFPTHVPQGGHLRPVQLPS